MKTLPILLIPILLVACDGSSASLFPNSPSPTASGSFPSASVAAQASPTPPAVPERAPAIKGKPSEDCVEGWTRPSPGSALAMFPLRVIRRTVRIPGDPEVVDMRYFVGPESPPSEKGYLLEIERWYVKLYAKDDLRFQGRFLVESREFGSGVAAVAPYDTHGFRSPDWSGFQWNQSAPRPRAYPGLPGRWAGTRYDFVLGGAGLSLPGLPSQVTGCLDTT